eukprot:TCONS_00003253-protein
MDQHTFVADSIEKFCKGDIPHDFIFRYPYKTKGQVNDVIVWDPRIIEPTCTIFCPKCKDNVLTDNRWKNGEKSYEGPRKLYGVTQDALLVSRVYLCRNNHQSIAHDQGILEQCIFIDTFPFHLFFKCGITKELYDFIITHFDVGLSPSDIQVLWQQTQFNHFTSIRDEKENNFENKGLHLALKIINSCIIERFFKWESLYTVKMTQTTATSSISCDHTFKVSANIGLYIDGSWVKICDNLFVVLNEKGDVLAWQLGLGVAFDNVKEILSALKDRLKRQESTMKMILIDNCCQWRSKLESVFGD